MCVRASVREAPTAVVQGSRAMQDGPPKLHVVKSMRHNDKRNSLDLKLATTTTQLLVTSCMRLINNHDRNLGGFLWRPSLAWFPFLILPMSFQFRKQLARRAIIISIFNHRKQLSFNVVCLVVLFKDDRNHNNSSSHSSWANRPFGGLKIENWKKIHLVAYEFQLHTESNQDRLLSSRPIQLAVNKAW